MRRTKTRPGGRPARPGQEGRAQAHTRGTWVWRPPTRKGRCRRPNETAPVHRPSPPSNHGRYRKPDASVAGSTHANHRSARSPRPAPEGPARDNPIAGPRTGTTRSELSAPATAGASGRHNEPGSRPASACTAQPPSKARGPAPGSGKGTRASGKPTRALRATGPDEARRTRRGHEARHRGTPPATTKAHAQVPSNNGRPVPGTRRARTARNEREAVPSNTSRRPDGRGRARQQTQPLPATEQPPSRWTSVRPEGTQPLPATRQPPSGWTSARPEGTQPLPAMNSRRPDGRVSAPQQRPAHATHSATHRASAPVNRSQVAQAATHPTQHTERAHR